MRKGERLANGPRPLGSTKSESGWGKLSICITLSSTQLLFLDKRKIRTEVIQVKSLSEHPNVFF
jgi:hypothetical protein